jgi:hypothetical protein
MSRLLVSIGTLNRYEDTYYNHYFITNAMM